MSLSPLCPSLTNDLHVRTIAKPLPGFPLASSFQGIVHHLSGAKSHIQPHTVHKYTQAGVGTQIITTQVASSSRHTQPHAKSTPWSVFQDGSDSIASCHVSRSMFRDANKRIPLTSAHSRTKCIARALRYTTAPLTNMSMVPGWPFRAHKRCCSHLSAATQDPPCHSVQPANNFQCHLAPHLLCNSAVS